jgi:hypothetical protein
MAGLELKHPGFGKAFKADPTKAVKMLAKDDVELAYWAGSSLAVLSLSFTRNSKESNSPATGFRVKIRFGVKQNHLVKKMN